MVGDNLNPSPYVENCLDYVGQRAIQNLGDGEGNIGPFNNYSSQENVEEKISDYMNENFDSCINFLKSEGLNIETGNPVVASYLSPQLGKLILNLNMTTVIRIEGKTGTYNHFSTRLPVNISKK